MGCLAGGEKGEGPHVTVISQRRGGRGVAGDLVRRMSAHQDFSFHHVDMDNVDTSSGERRHDSMSHGRLGTSHSCHHRTRDTRLLSKEVIMN